MTDALSIKSSSIGCLATIYVVEQPLAGDVHRLANSFIRLQISDEGGVFTLIEVYSSLINQICVHQFEDEMLYLIQEKVSRGEAKGSGLDDDGVSTIGVWIYVPKVSDFDQIDS